MPAGLSSIAIVNKLTTRHMEQILPLTAIRDFCHSQRDWALDTIEALVSLESPTTDKIAVDRCGGELASRLTSIGGRVTTLPRTDRGDHLLCEFGCGSSQLLLLGHFDTVWPVGALARMPLARSGGRLTGPGVFDMKAGIAIGMLATRALLETGAALSKRIVMLWTTDEEMGSGTSRAAIEDEARRSDAVLVLEPSLDGGAVKTARKGVGQYVLSVRGVAAHAGIEPEKGANAIHELANQIVRIQKLAPRSPGISINVGLIQGGARVNVIPDAASAVVDARAMTRNDMDRINAFMHAHVPTDAATTVDVTGGFERPPLERTDGVVRLYEKARDVARLLGHDLSEGATGGGSDGNFTAALGVPTLDGLGAIGGGAHALNEHIYIDTVPDRAALIAGLITNLGRPAK
jgi:glutamate carboxypeptidase